jgi:uncharacterized protein (TIGR02118 family)
VAVAVITISYKHGVKMNQDYYMTTHVPIVARVWGAQRMERAEIRKLTAAADGSSPPYQIIASVYFPSLEAFQAALQHPSNAEVMDDIKNYYEGMPDIYFGEVLS